MQANDSRLGSAANLSWTPVPQFGGVNDDGAYTVSNNRYNKISAKVYEGEAQITWTGKGTKIGPATFTGLPVTPATGATTFPAGHAYPIAMAGLTDGGSMMLAVSSGILLLMTQTTAAAAALTDANFTATTSIRIKWRVTIA